MLTQTIESNVIDHSSIHSINTSKGFIAERVHLTPNRIEQKDFVIFLFLNIKEICF